RLLADIDEVGRGGGGRFRLRGDRAVLRAHRLAPGFLPVIERRPAAGQCGACDDRPLRAPPISGGLVPAAVASHLATGRKSIWSYGGHIRESVRPPGSTSDSSTLRPLPAMDGRADRGAGL